jgi:hypothetical protein
MAYIETVERLSRRELMDLLRYSTWTLETGAALSEIVTGGKVAEEDLAWLEMRALAAGLGGTHGYGQLAALIASRNADLGPVDKLAIALANKADWIARRVIGDAPEDLLPTFEAMISTSRRPKGAKRELLNAVAGRLSAQSSERAEKTG